MLRAWPWRSTGRSRALRPGGVVGPMVGPNCGTRRGPEEQALRVFGIHRRPERVEETVMAVDLADDKLAGMSFGGWFGEAGDFAVRNASRASQFVGEGSQSRAENDGAVGGDEILSSAA